MLGRADKARADVESYFRLQQRSDADSEAGVSAVSERGIVPEIIAPCAKSRPSKHLNQLQIEVRRSGVLEDMPEVGVIAESGR